MLYDLVFEKVKEKLSKSGGCHDFDHTLRVISNAADLTALLPEADAGMVKLGALLHDYARPEEDDSCGSIDHAVHGAELVFRLLVSLNCSQEFAGAVSKIVQRHRFRGEEKPETLEEKIVYDADKLDSLGAVGIGRAFLFAGKTGARLHNKTSVALAGAPYSVEDTAYREYLVKLRFLPEKMQTSPGRKIAAERLKIMDEFFRDLDAETGINR